MKKRDLAKDLIDLEEANDFWQYARDDALLSGSIKGPVLDVGCGTGVITKPLIGRGLDVYSVDVDKKACKQCKKVNPKTYCIDFNMINTKKFPLFNTIIMADTLEHIKYDFRTLRKAYKLLNFGGILILSVPYHMFFWTLNDLARHHYRRYSKKELRDKLIKSGFRKIKMKFWNFLALGPILAGKYFKFRVPHENISRSVFNSILRSYFIYFENHLPLPIGSEIICTAKKENG